MNNLAQHVAEDPFFLAPALNGFAASEGLDDAALAARLGCPEETLALLRLCRMPRAEAPHFGHDVARIAERFTLSADRLAEAVRRGQSLLHLRDPVRNPAADAAGLLLAAREPPPEEGDPS